MQILFPEHSFILNATDSLPDWWIRSTLPDPKIVGISFRIYKIVEVQEEKYRDSCLQKLTHPD